MPIDVSMYNTSPPQRVNPLEMLSTVANTANALGENRLLRAKIAMGDAYKQSVDQNGQLDVNKFQSIVASNPMTAPMAKEAFEMGNTMNQPMPAYDKSGQQIYKTRQQIQQGLNPPAQQNPQLQEHHAHLDTMESAIGGLVQKPDLSLKDVISTTGDLVAQGRMTPQEAAAEFAAMPHGQNGEPPTQEQLRPWLEGHLQKINQNRQQLNQHFGEPQMDPAQTGAEPPMAPQQPQMQQQAQPQVPEHILAGPPPGVVEAANVAASGSATALNELHNSVGGSAARIFQLEQASHGLSNSPTGPGTDTTNNIKSFFNAQSPAFLKKMGLKFNPDEIKNYDEANKYLTQYASGQAGAMGAGTDSKLATALSGNASTHISNLAARDVVRAAIALEHIQQAQAVAFDESGAAPQDYNKWQAKWNKEIDPRVFVMGQLDRDEQDRLVKSLDKTERSRFARTLNTAIKYGFIQIPQKEMALPIPPKPGAQ